MKKEYDYLIVGSGLFGSVFAHEAKKMGKKCLVIDKRAHLGGNVYCEKVADIKSPNSVNIKKPVPSSHDSKPTIPI